MGNAWRGFWWISAVVILLVLVVLVSAAAGYAAEGWDGWDSWDEGFNWEVAAIAGTALGTTTLALATLVLAVGTRNLARTARMQVGVEQEALAASFRPLLLNVPPGYGSTIVGFVPASEAVGRMGTPELVTLARANDGFRIELPVRNTGVGVAFVQEVFVVWKDRRHDGRARNGILPPAELTYLTIDDLPSDGEFESPEETRRFAVRVVYDDLGGNSWQTSLDVKWREKAGGWKVIAVENRATGAPDEQAVKSGDMWEEQTNSRTAESEQP